MLETPNGGFDAWLAAIDKIEALQGIGGVSPMILGSSSAPGALCPATTARGSRTP